MTATNGTNGKQPVPYLKVEEIDAAAVMWGRCIDPTKLAFAVEVQNRLQQTQPGKAIRWLFPDKKSAQSYQDYIRYRFGKFADSFLVSKLNVQPDGTCFLVVTRGANWRILEPDWHSVKAVSKIAKVKTRRNLKRNEVAEP